MGEAKDRLKALTGRFKRKMPEVPEGVKRAEAVVEAAKRVSKVRPITEE